MRCSHRCYSRPRVVTANHQVIALYNASKRVSTIADNDNLFLFQVVPLLTI